MLKEWDLSVCCLIHTKTVNIKMRLRVEKLDLVQCRTRMQSRHQECTLAWANLVAAWYSVILILCHTLAYRTWKGLHLQPLRDDIYVC